MASLSSLDTTATDVQVTQVADGRAGRAGPPDRPGHLEGSWNATAVLLDAGDAIEQTAASLPYLTSFASQELP